MWGQWSTCSVSCGEGTKERARHCEGDNCGDILYQDRKNCRRQSPCGKHYHHINHKRSFVACLVVLPNEWQAWSECSKTCGSGIITRTRSCDSFCGDIPLEQSGACNSQLCSKFLQSCTAPSSTNISVSDWSSWSECNVTCGLGSRHRRRECHHHPVCNNKKVESCQKQPCGKCKIYVETFDLTVQKLYKL